jgi:hypothetical protein
MTDYRQIACPQCDAVRSADDHYCSACGAPLRDQERIGVSKPGATSPSTRQNRPHLLIMVLLVVCSLALLLFLASQLVSGLPASVLRQPTLPQQSPTADLALRASPQSIPEPTNSPTASPSLPILPTVAPSMEGWAQTITALEDRLATAEAGTTAAAATPNPIPPACLSWRDASDQIGTYTCLCGKVTQTYQDPGSSAFFIDFSRDRSAFYAVSFDYYWQDLEDTCVQICGIVETYDGRPQIIIREPEHQLLECP